MGYKVKWVEDHLGITRKALRVFEKEGLMPQNKGGQYRDYSEEDIDRIWFIRLFQGMGYSLKEIASFIENANNENWDFNQSISQKVFELEKKIQDLEKHLGYAKTIKLTGRFPSRPKEMGSVSFNEFHTNSVEKWNINNSPKLKTAQKVIDVVLNQTTDDMSDSDIDTMLEFFNNLSNLTEKDMEHILTEAILPKAILKRIMLGPNHPEVQLLVKLIYDNQVELVPEMKNVTPQQFAHYQYSSFLEGDISKIKERDYGKQGCKFLADAFAIFGGYTNSDDPNLM